MNSQSPCQPSTLFLFPSFFLKAKAKNRKIEIYIQTAEE
jgi:hypothetical protein